MFSSFSTLFIRGWRQFGSLEINFHPRLTILTGTNGTGKTTILKLLAGQFVHGWPLRFAATAHRGDGQIEYSPDARDTYSGTDLPGADKISSSRICIGSVVSNDFVTLLSVPKQCHSQYEVIKTDLKARGRAPSIFGFHLPSHRINASYAAIDSVPTHPYSPQLAFTESVAAICNANQSANDLNKTPHHQRKSAMVSMSAFQYPRANSKKPEFSVIEKFELALQAMLPPSLMFQGLEFRGPEITVTTSRGDFALDSLSGGLESIVDLVWQCTLLSAFESSFVVVLDEPENHLHPAMQRTVLPTLLQTFPDAQFVIATHNPLIATSVEDSSLFFLDYGDEGLVDATLLSEEPKSGTVNEALRSFFGLPNTTPIWVAEKLKEIFETFSSQNLSDESLALMRTELENLGLSEYVPMSQINFATQKIRRQK